MADTIAFPAHAQSRAVSLPTIPWYLWASVIGVTSAMIGVHWDISWHRSIGRDTFWTPPHLAIYLCGVIAGLSSAYLILATTFGKLPEVRAASVKMWGFYGPLGAFVTAWGGLTMLVSAPFDDWWHNAYGLDVKILSPPHTVLATGIIGIEMGALMLVLGYMNRAEGEERRRLHWLYIYLGAMILVVTQILTLEYSFNIGQHTAMFYRAIAISVPTILVGIAAGSENRWAATIVAGIYTLFTASLIWILPLFPAEPKLGPVLHPVTQFIPPNFPLLLIVPAIAIDLLRRWFKGKTGMGAMWLQAVVLGFAFVATFLAVQWPFATFLVSPAGHNAFFGTIFFDYGTSPNGYNFRGIFIPTEQNFVMMMMVVVAAAIITTRIGLGWGNWMRTVKR